MTEETKRSAREALSPQKGPAGPEKSKREDNKRPSPRLVRQDGDSPRGGSVVSDMRFDPPERRARLEERQAARSVEDRRLAADLVPRLRQRLEDVSTASNGEIRIESEAPAQASPAAFISRWKGSQSERSLSIEVDPLAGTVVWALHYAGAVVRASRVEIAAFDERKLDDLLNLLANENAWLDGSMAIREDRTI